jgi:hypothetical protein
VDEGELMRVIGDTHGHIRPYAEILSGCTESIQIGDFGMGFLSEGETQFVDKAMSVGNHRFFRGNHDDPARCKQSDHFIPDGHYDPVRDMMCVGGAWSIDHEYRKRYDAHKGTTSWWPDEECTLSELLRIHAEYVYRKPKIVLSHDCPSTVSKDFYFGGEYQMLGPHRKTRTSEALQAMFMEHQPDLWIFGHWHISKTKKIDGTKFVCLAELEYLDI